MLEAGRPNAVKQVDDDPGDKADQELGEQAVYINRDNRVQAGQQEKQLRDGKARV